MGTDVERVVSVPSSVVKGEEIESEIVTFTEQENAAVRRKIDWVLLPLMCVSIGLSHFSISPIGPQNIAEHLPFHDFRWRTLFNTSIAAR